MTYSIKTNSTVFCDASVLYQAQIRDLLLELCVHKKLLRLHWSKQVQDEWINKLSRDDKNRRKSFERTRKRMEKHVPYAIVKGYGHLEGELDLPDIDDKHVLAAAIKAECEFLITENLKDFPDKVLSTYSIKAVSIDTFLSRLFDLYPDHILEAIHSIVTRLVNPPVGTWEWCDRLSEIGFSLIAEKIKGEIDIRSAERAIEECRDKDVVSLEEMRKRLDL